MHIRLIVVLAITGVLSRGSAQAAGKTSDLANDIGEQKNLAVSHPERVADLQKLYDARNAE